MAVTDTPSTANPDANVPPAGSDLAAANRLDAVYHAARLTLLIGFQLAAALLAIGLILAIARSQPLREETLAIREIAEAVRNGDSAAFVDLALLTIIATPVVTSLVVALTFAHIGDRLYALISLAVLAILSVSLILAAF